MSARHCAFLFAVLWLTSVSGWAVTSCFMQARLAAAKSKGEELQREVKELRRWKASAEEMAREQLRRAEERLRLTEERLHFETMKKEQLDRRRDGQKPDKAIEKP